jgi:Family of unknown function (DUF6225)
VHASPANITVGQLRAYLEELPPEQPVFASVPSDPEGRQFARFHVVGAEAGQVRSPSGQQIATLLLDCSFPSGTYAVEPRASMSLVHSGLEQLDLGRLVDDVDQVVGRDSEWRGSRQVEIDDENQVITWTWFGAGASSAARVALDQLAGRKVHGWRLAADAV